MFIIFMKQFIKTTPAQRTNLVEYTKSLTTQSDGRHFSALFNKAMPIMDLVSYLYQFNQFWSLNLTNKILMDLHQSGWKFFEFLVTRCLHLIIYFASDVPVHQGQADLSLYHTLTALANLSSTTTTSPHKVSTTIMSQLLDLAAQLYVSEFSNRQFFGTLAPEWNASYPSYVQKFIKRALDLPGVEQATGDLHLKIKELLPHKLASWSKGLLTSPSFLPNIPGLPILCSPFVASYLNMVLDLQFPINLVSMAWCV
jgi:hypothetical protein